MYCEHCGTKVEDTDVYCQNCGEIISANYKEANAGYKLPAKLLLIVGALVIIFGVIFWISNYITAPKQVSETNADAQDFQDIPDTNTEYSEEYMDFDIYTATEDETTETTVEDSVQTFSSQLVFDFADVLNEEDEKQLALEYSKISEAWKCNFAIFFLNDINEKSEAELYDILEQSNTYWDSSIPNIVYAYSVSNGQMNAYSSNNSLDMLGMYTKEYIDCNSTTHYAPIDSSDYYSTGAVLLNTFSSLHEYVDDSYTFCEEDLRKVELDCKKALAYKDYRLLLDGTIGTEILTECTIDGFCLVDMNADGLEELVVSTLDFIDVDTYYIFQWDNFEFYSWLRISQDVSPLYIKEDNSLLAYWLGDDTLYPYHYVLTDNGIEIKDDEPGIKFGEDAPLSVIPYNPLQIYENTPDNHFIYLYTGLD